MNAILVALALSGLPTLDVGSLSPSVTDTWADLSFGAGLGATVAPDRWEAEAALPYGLRLGAKVYGQNGTTDRAIYGGAGNTGPYNLDPGAVGLAAYKTGTFSANQWEAMQIVIPFDSETGCFNALRVDPATRSGYGFTNVGSNDTANFSVNVYRIVNGVATQIGYFTFASNDGTGTGNYGTIDGRHWGDGAVLIVEVAGSNPVELRASLASPRGDEVAWQIAFPAEIQLGVTSGLPAVDPGRVFTVGAANVTASGGKLLDASPQRILSGRPGVWARGQNYAGSVYNFNAGEYPPDPAPPGLPMKSRAGQATWLRDRAGNAAALKSQPLVMGDLLTNLDKGDLE